MISQKGTEAKNGFQQLTTFHWATDARFFIKYPLLLNNYLEQSWEFAVFKEKPSLTLKLPFRILSNTDKSPFHQAFQLHQFLQPLHCVRCRVNESGLPVPPRAGWQAAWSSMLLLRQAHCVLQLTARRYPSRICCRFPVDRPWFWPSFPSLCLQYFITFQRHFPSVLGNQPSLLTFFQDLVVKKDQVMPLLDSGLEIVDDMISMDELNQAVILHNLRERYKKSEIYVPGITQRKPGLSSLDLYWEHCCLCESLRRPWAIWRTFNPGISERRTEGATPTTPLFFSS